MSREKDKRSCQQPEQLVQYEWGNNKWSDSGTQDSIGRKE